MSHDLVIFVQEPIRKNMSNNYITLKWASNGMDIKKIVEGEIINSISKRSPYFQTLINTKINVSDSS